MKKYSITQNHVIPLTTQYTVRHTQIYNVKKEKQTYNNKYNDNGDTTSENIQPILLLL